MKKLSLLLASLMVIISCSSDSDSNGTTTAFIGKWTIEFEKEYTSTGTLYQTYDHTDDECYGMTTYEFKTNSEFVKDSYDFVTSTCIRNPVRTYNYTHSGNTIIINDEEPLEIIENTSSVLKLKETYTNGYYKITEYSKVN
jgi:hypothetical protein